MTKQTRLTAIFLVSTAILSGCSSKGVSPHDVNQLVEVSYAKVISTKPVKFDSKADEAAAIGALEGAIDGAHHGDSDAVLAGAITGAIFSAIATKIEEGSSEGLLLSLVDTENTNLNLIVRRKDIVAGDCLRLIQGESVSVTHVDGKLCTTNQVVSAQ